MGLRFGWRKHETRETIWREDSALGDVPKAVLAQWREDPDASYLLPYVKPGEKPEVFTYRTLTPDEREFVRGFISEENGHRGERAYLWAFRIGVSFPSVASESITDVEGVSHDVVETVKGIPMLSEGFVAALLYAHKDIVIFYGSRILNASFLTEAEKKASSPPSTQKPSSEAPPAPTANGSTMDATAVSAATVGAVA